MSSVHGRTYGASLTSGLVRWLVGGVLWWLLCQWLHLTAWPALVWWTGCLWATRFAARTVRLDLLGGLGLGLGVLLYLLGQAVGDWGLFPALLGPTGALWWSAQLRILAAVTVVGVAGTAWGRKARWIGVLEVLAAVAVPTTMFVAHEQGSVGRPYVIGDLAIELGIDPVWLFLGIGALLAGALWLGRLSEGRLRSRWWWVAVMPVVFLVVGRGLYEEVGRERPEEDPVTDLMKGEGDRGHRSRWDDGTPEDDQERQDEQGEQPEEPQPRGEEPQGQQSEDAEQTKGEQQQPPEQGQAGEDGQEIDRATSEDREGQGQGELGEEGVESPDQAGKQGEGGAGEQSQAAVGEEGASRASAGEGGEDAIDMSGGSDADNPNRDAEEQDDESEKSPPQPVAVILLGDDIEPAGEIFYVFQEPHSVFNGVRLVAAPEGSPIDRDAFDRFPASVVDSQAPPPAEGRTPVQGSVSIMVEHAKPMALAHPVQLSPRLNPNPGKFLRSWNFESLVMDQDIYALVGMTADTPDWPDAVRNTYLEAPDDPRYQALVDELMAPIPEEYRRDPWVVGLTFKSWLDENMTYDSSVKHKGGDDPTADFLFGDTVGYCVHAAHSFAFLMRTAGFPARIGSGYAVKPDYRRGSTLLVTDSAAHAWAEVWTDQMGWLILDANPLRSNDEEGSGADEALIQQLGELARQEPEAVEESRPLRAWWRKVQESLQRMGEALVRSLPTVVLVVLSWAWVRKLWFAFSPLLGGAARTRRTYRAALQALASVGQVRRQGESMARFGDHVRKQTDAFRPILQAHLRNTYGGADAEVPAGALRDLRRDIRSRQTFLQTLWSWLDPTTSYRIR